MPLIVLAIYLSNTGAPLFADEESDAQAARDAAIVETLLRLDNIDVNSRPDLKVAVLRYLDRHKETDRYLELVERFELRDAADELIRLAAAKSGDTIGVNAARLLLSFGETERLNKVINEDKEPAPGLVSAVGLVGGPDAIALLKPLITNGKRSVAVRSAAANGLGRNRDGQRYLLELAKSDKLPADLNFTVANTLFASPDEAIRTEAAKHLELPATADSEPLPPVAELIQLAGSAERGKVVFDNKGTCAKCHKVRGEGKEVGPDLSEIGSKLSKDAFFVSILDPSAGISHNYESYTAVLVNGTVVTGILISETDDSVTLKTAEAIEQKISKSKIEELVKQKVSLMPAGLQKTMSAQELVDLVEYLTTLKKEGP